MSPEQQREKVYQTFAYFIAEEEVLHPYKTKLFKLLFYTDFLHYENYGRAVTGLEYFAWEHGPVPKSFWHDWENSAPEFVSHFFIIKKNASQSLRPRFKFNENYFSNSELEIMKHLAKKHFKDTGKMMSELTHLQTQPWDEVRNVQKNPDGLIPYELALLRKLSENDKATLEHARLNEAIQKQFSR